MKELINLEGIEKVRPRPAPSPDFSDLVDLCESYLNSIGEQSEDFLGIDHYVIFEVAIKCVYGKDSGVFDYINSLT